MERSKEWILVPGHVYRLHDSVETYYRVTDAKDPDDWSDYNCELQSVHSGWTFTAHGTKIYPDGSIEWDFSTNGRFENEF